jgi:hypothetical protein
MVPADQVEFEAEKEPWTIYKLEDGTVVKIKTILGNVSRLVDRYKPDGEPIYLLTIGGMPILDIAPELRRPSVQAKQHEG